MPPAPTPQAPFGARLLAAMDTFGPLCVGLDPSADVLAAWDRPDTVDGLAHFTDRLCDQLPGRAGIVKPQVAFYERFGAPGFALLEEAVARLREAGLVVILDAKRNDIGSSMAGYADAYFGAGPMRVDAITAGPYLGVGALTPLVEAALEVGGGVFVLARTSNPEGVELQNAVAASGRTVYQAVYDAVAGWNRAVEPLGSLGVVVGATVDGDPAELVGLNGPILAPGLGYQGASATDLARRMGPALANVVPNSSRGVLLAGPAGFADAVATQADACRVVREECLKESG